MKKSIVAAFAAPILLFAAAAQAADLPRRGAPDPYYAPPPASMVNWQGLYVGINAGYGFGSFEANDFNVWQRPGVLLGTPAGGMVGVTGGYNFVPSHNLLLGVEADFDFAGIKSSRMPLFGYASEASSNYLMTVRGRAGYIMDRALLFVTGGFAASRTSIGFANFWQGFQGRESYYQPDWALGAGLEFMVTNNLSAKGEYIFTSVGSDRFFNFSPASLQAGVNTSTVKAGLNYHF